MRIVVPFPAGATTDLLARLIANRLSETMGQSFVVENVGGGAARSAPIRSPRLPPTATRCCFTTSRSRPQPPRCCSPRRHGMTSTILCRFRSALMCRCCCSPTTMCRPRTSRNSSPTPRPHRRRCSNGSTGPGSILHLMGEGAQTRCLIKMDHVPYRGAAPLVTDLIAGACSSAATSFRARLSAYAPARSKAMAVATKSVALPSVPTVRELGYPNLELQGWNGFLAPKGTPEPVIARLQQEIAAAVKTPDVQKRMTDVGAEPSGSTQDRDARHAAPAGCSQIRPWWRSSSFWWNRRRRSPRWSFRWSCRRCQPTLPGRRAAAARGVAQHGCNLRLSRNMAHIADSGAARRAATRRLLRANAEFGLVILASMGFTVFALMVFALAYAWRGAPPCWPAWHGRWLP